MNDVLAATLWRDHRDSTLEELDAAIFDADLLGGPDRDVAVAVLMSIAAVYHDPVPYS